MRWDRLAAVRTAVLTLAGLACVVWGVALIFPPAGFIAAGAGLFLIEALTSPEPGREVRRA